MRIPLSWLGEFVELPAGVTPEQVHSDLVSVGLEEEDIHRFDLSGPIVVGEVLDFVDEPQDNGKTIRWCQVKVAEHDLPDQPAVRGIVCGASNFVVGDKVVVTLPGSVLPGPFPISARKTYGHVSDGMIASAKELGLGDDHSGILRLAERGIDAPVGTDAIALLGLDDIAVEVNVTPDRGYALSMRGIAREYHHATGARFTDPAMTLSVGQGNGFQVAVDDRAPIRGQVGCQVFVTRSVRGIDPTRPTPAFMVSRLKLAGIRSISLPVDITNYVMLELGQPIHGYDLDRLSGGIVVRRAEAGETLRTLDDQLRTLDPEDLLITDASGPIGLAGVMGGHSTEISDQTRNVLIEAAWFEPVSIARTARRHKLPSEAQKRFQRGVDPLIQEVAAQRVVDLLVAYAGGEADDLGSTWRADGVGVMSSIEFTPDHVLRLAGMSIEPARIRAILEDVGCRVEEQGPYWLVTPPSWRPDLVDWPTLVEEVARVVGYDHIPSSLPIAPAGRGLSPRQRATRRITQGLAASGLTEVLSYPFVTEQTNDLWGDGGRQVPVANALDAEVGMLRRSLVPGLIEVAKRNLSRGLTDLALFEAGVVFLPDDRWGTDDIPEGAKRPDPDTLWRLQASLPRQPWCVAGLFAGVRQPRGVGQTERVADVADALDAAHRVARLAGVSLVAKQATHPAFHPGRFATLHVGDTLVGRVGEILPRLALEADLPRRVAVFEIDGDALLAVVPELPEVLGPLSGYPAATQDVSVVVDASISVREVSQALRVGAGDLLESIRFVDEYRGEGIEPGKRSLTFALMFRAADRTLTQAEASEAREKGVEEANRLFGATLRA